MFCFGPAAKNLIIPPETLTANPDRLAEGDVVQTWA